MSDSADKSPTRRRATSAKYAATDQGAGEAERNLQDVISQRAYQIWETEGRPGGRSEEHWMQAEREVRAAQAATAYEPTLKRRAPRRDSSGAVAKPMEQNEPGASAELDGTPSAAAVGGGRGAGAGARRRATTRTS